MKVEATIPRYKLASMSNMHKHWRVIHKERVQQRNLTAYYLRNYEEDLLEMKFPVRVTLTRVSVGQLDDDNLKGAFKSIRDQIADMMGVNDRSREYDWVYEQRSEGKDVSYVTIAIEEVSRGRPDQGMSEVQD